MLTSVDLCECGVKLCTTHIRVSLQEQSGHDSYRLTKQHTNKTINSGGDFVVNGVLKV